MPYFPPAAAAAGPRVRCTNAGAAQTLTSGTSVPMTLDTDTYDGSDMHFTSAANLTGTVAKAASSATLVGTGTAFLSQLSVGQVISVPGTAAEARVVTAIASDTSLTVASTFANTASGQTATRLNTAIVIREAGIYEIGAHVQFAASAVPVGRRALFLQKNRTTNVTVANYAAVTTANTDTAVGLVTNYDCALWDYFEVVCAQNQTANVDINVGADFSPVFWARKL